MLKTFLISTVYKFDSKKHKSVIKNLGDITMQNMKSLSEFQYYLRGVLYFFDQLCRRNNIKYTVFGGTLLGAVRNHGFIPWDGDVDVAMTREEFAKLEKVFDKYSGRFYLNHLPNHFYRRRGYKRSRGDICAKIIDKKSDNQLFGIDVMIIDFLGDDLSYAKETVKNYNDFGRKKAASVSFHLPRWGKSFLRNIKIGILFVLYPILKIISLLYTPIYIRRYESFVRERLNYGENSKYFTVYPYSTVFGVLENKLLINGYQDIPFDGMNVMSVSNYDVFLSAAYGQYMTPPPKEKQIPFPSMKELLEVSIEVDEELAHYCTLANN